MTISKDYIVKGKGNLELSKIFNECMNGVYLTNEQGTYHQQNSTIILPLKPSENNHSKKGLFKLLTEPENERKVIEFIKQITKSEVEEKW